jgi:hypothetical protein
MIPVVQSDRVMVLMVCCHEYGRQTTFCLHGRNGNSGNKKMSKCEGFVSLESKAVCCVCVFVRGGGVRQGGTGAATPVKDYSCIETS